MTRIPVVDVSSAIAGGDASGPAQAIADACRTVGFMQVVGHGIEASLLDGVYTSAGAVFALPQAEKAALAPPDGRRFRGLHQDWHAESGRVVFEQFEVNRFDDAAAARAAGVPAKYGDYFRPNIWPSQVPGLRQRWLDCFAATTTLGLRIMSLFAIALGRPPGYFDGAMALGVHNFGVNWYPPQPAGPARPTRVLVPHSDSGVLTLLHQRADYAGLEVQLRNGDWIQVPVRSDAFVVNIGQLMARWTNGRWQATRHRVCAAENPDSSKTSVVTFMLPAVDTVVTPLTDEAEPTRYGPVMVYDWESVFLAELDVIKQGEGLGKRVP
jgi:isopenicillin N synthase-like dioxygenase